jgi:hypothetical protein
LKTFHSQAFVIARAIEAKFAVGVPRLLDIGVPPFQLHDGIFLPSGMCGQLHVCRQGLDT